MPRIEDQHERSGQFEAGARYLDGSYRSQNPDWHEADSPWKAEQVRKLLGKHNLVPRSICDVGCGPGRVLVALQKSLPSGTYLIGFEPSKATTRPGIPSPDGITIVNNEEDLGEQKFDAILLLDVIEHVENYIGFLRHLAGKSDYTVLHIPLEMSLQGVARMSPLLAARSSVGHLHYFSRETALATLNDAGYEVLDAVFTRSGIDAHGQSLRERIAAMPRRILYRLSPLWAARVLGGFSLLVLARATPAPPAVSGSR